MTGANTLLVKLDKVRKENTDLNMKATLREATVSPFFRNHSFTPGFRILREFNPPDFFRSLNREVR
jgi:hypothetical protein